MKDELLDIANQKALEYSELKHKEEFEDPCFERNICESQIDFARGFVAGYRYNIELTKKLLPETTLTRKQAEAHHFVEMHWKWFDKPPTYRVVAKAFKIAPSAAFARLKHYRHRMKKK